MIDAGPTCHRRRGRPARPVSPAIGAPPTAVRFPAPTRFGLGAVLEHSVCNSLNVAGIPTDTAGWLLLPGTKPERLLSSAVEHLDAALQAQNYGAGYWSADLEPTDEACRYRLLIGDAWATSTQILTFRSRSVELHGAVVHLSARNTGRRVVRLLAQAAASALVQARPETAH